MGKFAIRIVSPTPLKHDIQQSIIAEDQITFKKLKKKTTKISTTSCLLKILLFSIPITKWWLRTYTILFWSNCNFQQEMFKDSKGVFRSCRSKKARQYNGQMKKEKQWSTKHYTVWVTRNPLITGMNSCAPEW